MHNTVLYNTALTMHHAVRNTPMTMQRSVHYNTADTMQNPVH